MNIILKNRFLFVLIQDLVFHQFSRSCSYRQFDFMIINLIHVELGNCWWSLSEIDLWRIDFMFVECNFWSHMMNGVESQFEWSNRKVKIGVIDLWAVHSFMSVIGYEGWIDLLMLVGLFVVYHDSGLWLPIQTRWVKG